MSAIYLDHNASTPPHPCVVEGMLVAMREQYANPSNIFAEAGRAARQRIEEARQRVAACVGVPPRRIVFTSGATEANNLALRGALEAHRRTARPMAAPPRVLASAVEHKSVLAPLEDAASRGDCVLGLIPTDPTGVVAVEEVERRINADTLLVAVMFANNEVGTLQPVGAISRLCAERGVMFHCDITQAVGKCEVPCAALGLTTAALSAHKLYGPKGVGALVLPPDGARIQPQLLGGEQEHGLRAGTENVPGIVGFGIAAEIATDGRVRLAEHLSRMSELFLDRLRAACGDLALNGPEKDRLPGTLSLAIRGVDASSLMESTPEVALSSGSACNSRQKSMSHVLRAMGLTERRASETIRISCGMFSTDDEVTRAADLIAAQVVRLRRFMAD